MPKDTVSTESLLSQARRLEETYDWLGATDAYNKTLSSVPEHDSSTMGQIHELLGYAFHKAAMQAESPDEFKSLTKQATEHYCKAKEYYQKVSGNGTTPFALRCDAMNAYLTHWLVEDASEKRKQLHQSWDLTKECLRLFEAAGNGKEYGRTYNQLVTNVIFIFALEWKYEERGKPITEAVERGEQTIKFLSALEDKHELAKAYAKTLACTGVFGYYFQDEDERERAYQKGLDYQKKAEELSEETRITESLYPVFGSHIIYGLEGTEEALTNYKKALEYARKTKDNFIIGCALDWLTYHTFWKIHSLEDPLEAQELLEVAVDYAKQAKQHYHQLSYISPRADLAWTDGIDVEHLSHLTHFTTDTKKKHDLIEKAIRASTETRRIAEQSGYPEAMMYAYSGSSFFQMTLSMAETHQGVKRKLLEQALESARQAMKIGQEVEPLLYWNLGIGQNRLSTIELEISELEKDPKIKKQLLQDAITHREKSLQLCTKELAFLQTKGTVSSLYGSFGESQYTYGILLNRLYTLDKNKQNMTKAIEAYEDAIRSYQELNLSNRVAECYWRIAQTHDMLDENLNAAQDFSLASDNYRKSAEKTPELKKLYDDHVLYMQAWSEIERARYHHARQDYGSAEEHFEKAASLHKSLKEWSYLAPNYAAWAKIEHAEELSRKEQGEEAIKAFQDAATLFEESRQSLQQQVTKIENPDEKQMATNILNATEYRSQYCRARITLEEAKILDKKGDHSLSSDKYDAAAETFQEISETLESEQEKKEFKLIATLSKARAKMTQAEAEQKPSLYSDASQLFEEAKEFSPNEKARMLALGHSRFCRALEVGTKFADTRDITLLNPLMQHLESASNYYVRAGFQNASEYAKATKLLFEAYVHMDNAQTETDPEKKARLYTMAEKILQTSAGSFMKAEHPEKREQVLRLLEKVREERELALSLSEVLHAPSIVATTNAFTTPSPTHEIAVGLENFESANVQANLVTNQKELRIGEDLNLEIELINAGKSPAMLAKITEIIPEGFELAEKPVAYRMEDSQLNMKGKRLDPLKTEEVKLTLKPKAQGVFPLKPKIMYLDENGKYKLHQPEPVTITVKELGIKGWLKGER